MQPEVAVETVVTSLRAWDPAPDQFAILDAVEAAVVDSQPGLVVTWTQATFDQGVRKFGLIVTGRELLEPDEWSRSDEDPALGNVLAAIRLLVIEPHGTSAGRGARTWFRTLSS
jgi:hypothetical protein